VINIKVKSKGNESGASLLRRFSRKVKHSGIVHKVKKIRYKERGLSEYKKKQNKIRNIRKKAEIERNIKLGKTAPKRWM